MSREAFGPNLRRTRVQRGIRLEEISAALKVSPELLEGLERNDFSLWPSGIFARSYVRQYAEAIGVDPDGTVDEFCRWFPEGDRRVERVVREHALMVGHQLEWDDQLPPPLEGVDRRATGLPAQPAPLARSVQSPLWGLFTRVRRALGKA
jgi:transcriptional regulator with XRE-family HTH domain